MDFDEQFPASDPRSRGGGFPDGGESEPVGCSRFHRSRRGVRMAATAAPGVRRSLADIQRDYDNGNTAELEKLMRAWKGIKELPPADLRSFFVIGGYHGEPFRGKGE